MYTLDNSSEVIEVPRGVYTLSRMPFNIFGLTTILTLSNLHLCKHNRLELQTNLLEVIMGRVGPKKLTSWSGWAKILCPKPVISGQNEQAFRAKIE